MKKLILFLITLCLSLSTFAQTGDYFVDSSRPDDTGAGTSWATAKKTISAALTLIGTPSIYKNLFIAQGTYTAQFTGSGNRINFYGGFPTGGSAFADRNWKLYPTIIDGNYPTNTNSSSITLNSNVKVFDGFIIQNCYTSGAGTVSGVQLSTSNIVVSNCIIRGCVTNPSNGNPSPAVRLSGVAGSSSSSSPIIRDCEIYSNYTITSSRALNGSAVHISDGGTIQNCKIYNNSQLYTDPITGTSGGSAAIYIQNSGTSQKLKSNVYVVNNLIYNNSAGTCSGIFINLNQTNAATDSTIYIVNNTIANNKALGGTDGFLKVTLANLTTEGTVNTIPARIQVNNNIFWGNLDNATATVPTASIAKTTFTYNAVQGDITGLDASNKTLSATNATDVKFTSPSASAGCSLTKANYAGNQTASETLAAADWSISSTSAAKEAGSNAALTATRYRAMNVTTDFIGNARIVGTIDMGAYENTSASATPTITGTATATAFTTTYGTTSAKQDFSVSSSDLTADITATAPTGFEVASDGATFGATATITKNTNGTLSLRLKADAAVGGSYNGVTVSLASTGATTKYITTAASGNTVSAKALTITATGPAKTYGTALTAGTSASNFSTNGAEVSGEAVTSVTLTPDASGLSAATAAGTAYVVTPSLATGTGGFLASNYNITYTAYNGTVAAATANKTGGNIDALGLTDTELENTDVTITSGELVVNTGKTVRSITVNGGAQLTVPTGQTLTLTNLTLKSDASSTATYVPEGNGVLTVTGTTAVEQYLATTRNWYVSSPVSNAVAPAGYTYFSRDESGSNPSPVAPATAYWVSVAPGAGLTAGKGYIALPATAGAPITFTTQNGGTLNTGNVTVNLTYTPTATSGKGYNLIGNPYPSHLSWTSAFATANAAKIEASIWYRTNSGSSNASGWSFVTYNPITGESVPTLANGGIIPPMQGFWVLAKQTTTIEFTNAMRSHQTGNPLKAPATTNPDRKKVRLQVSNGTRADEALIVFDANATDGYDAYDSPKMMNNATDIADIYTVVDAKNLVINGMNSVKYNTEIPVGFSTLSAGDFSITLSEFSNFEDGTRVFIKDTQNPTAETELTPEAAYHFSAPVTTANANRFSLLFRAPASPNGLNNTEKLNAQVFVNAANQITIVAPEKANYAIYNAMGQLIENGVLNMELQTVNCKLQTGIYVVKVGAESKRVIIK